MSRFEVLVLGNSSALPAYGRHPSAQLINVHEHFILIDCGEGTQERLVQYQTKPHKIEHIFISHLHGDHYFGLPGLLTTLNLSGRKEKLHVYSPPGLQGLMQSIMDLAMSVLSFEVVWIELMDDKAIELIDDAVKKVIAFPLTHRVPTYGFLIKEKPGKRVFNASKIIGNLPSYEVIRKLKDGLDVVLEDGTIMKSLDYTSDPLPPKSYAYCSDTIFQPEICQYIREADLLYHEATYTESHKSKAIENHHSTAYEAATIAEIANVKKLAIGHFSSRYKDLNVLLAEAKGKFDNVLIAEEGNWIEV
jgi:ribonuclease Z